MKTHVLGKKVSLTAAAWLAVFLCVGATGRIQAAEDMNAVFQQGRAAFYRGDFATAQQLLARVAAVNPRHPETVNMLAYIKANGKLTDPTLERQYAAIILPKVEFSEVTLSEALEGLRMLAKNASGGKVTPNVIVRGEDVAQRKLSINLSNVPLTEALNYVGQLTNTRLTYDKHAVIISSMADLGSATAEASSKDGAKAQQ